MWKDVAPLLKDASARPFIPYNFLRDLDPGCLQRLDDLLEKHLVIDENRAMNGGPSINGEVRCRYEECGQICLNGHIRGQHERHVHGKAKSNG